ncbi:hypothetical protein GIB67_008866 [Kingdonia uniflora]|uniref:Peptidase A1 domain-containing protein n=1 Tax=Kingdonia uniflora TaxID=39325 RepID=A0A7J7LVL8_9MAGN|nr:hypothetical protein GIB67_008866 [Kingdonia uniflora]
MGAFTFFLRLSFTSYVLLLVFISCSESVSAEKGEGEITDGGLHNLRTHAIRLSSVVLEATCSPSPLTSTSIKGSSTKPSLKILHKHNPCSKSKRTKSSENLLMDILQQDRARVESVQHRLLDDVRKDLLKSSKAKLPAQSGRSIGTGNYIVRVGFGTPKKDLTLIFDTGSDLTWIQCEPCAKACYSQQDPIFDPSKSTSYSNITCNTTECNKLKSATGITPGCSASTSACIYGIQYGDQSFSVGYFAHETLTISPSDVFPKFLFGCGQNQEGLFAGAAGLIGLGRDTLSLVSQTASKYGRVFSYCLPSRTSSIGYLALGQTGISSSVKFTPMLSDSRSAGFYFIRMTDFSVGGRKLGIPNSVFTTSSTIIDSGTVITRLPPSAYTPLRTAFRNAMSKYPLTDPISILDTCYDLTNYTTVLIPKIGMFYSPGIMVDVDPSGILIAATASQVCLAFAPNTDDGDVAILGNTQQKNLEVIYDVAKGRVGFGPGSCG